MQRYRANKPTYGIRAATAIGVAALAAAATLVPSTAWAATSSGPSGTLKIITWVNPPAVAAITKIDQLFEQKYPNVHVQLQTAANVTAGYATLLSTTVDANTADIVTNVYQIQPLPLHPTRSTMLPTQYWASSGVYLPLNNEPWIHNFTSSALATETYNGQIYGVLSGVYQRVVFYNKTDFAKYHISVPTTYNQFLTVLKTLSADHVTPLWLGVGGGASIYVPDFLTEPLMAELWLPHVAGNNIFTATQTGAAKFNNPYYIQAMTEEAAIGKYIEPDYTGVPWTGMPGAFASNKAAMLLDGSWDLASVQKANPGIQVGSFPLPGSNVASANQPLLQPDLNFEILKHAQNMPAAQAWMAFFASQPIYEQYVDITGISPSETSGTYSSFSSKVLGSWLGKGINVLSVTPNWAPTRGYYDTPVQYPLLQEAVLSGSKSPQDVAKLVDSNWK